MRRADYLAEELAGQVEVGSEAGPARDLLEPVVADGAGADVLVLGPVPVVLVLFGDGHAASCLLAAARTDRTILS